MPLIFFKRSEELVVVLFITVSILIRYIGPSTVFGSSSKLTNVEQWRCVSILRSHSGGKFFFHLLVFGKKLLFSITFLCLKYIFGGKSVINFKSNNENKKK